MRKEIFKVVRGTTVSENLRGEGFKYDIWHSFSTDYKNLNWNYLNSHKTLVEAINGAIKRMTDPLGSVLMVEHQDGTYKHEERLMKNLRNLGHIK